MTLLVSGCATLGVQSVDHTPLSLIPVKNEKTINLKFDEVWGDLVGDFSKTSYVINNIDKQSGLINVSFRFTKGISNYVDCGTSNRQFSLGKIQQNINFKTADGISYFRNAEQQQREPNTIYYEMFVIPLLEGKANILVVPSGEGTKVSVNARYTWSMRGEYDTYMYMPLYKSHNIMNPPGRRQVTSMLPEVSFNTSQFGEEGGLKCASTGKFETDILGLLDL
jgi:hypothetical protein